MHYCLPVCMQCVCVCVLGHTFYPLLILGGGGEDDDGDLGLGDEMMVW